VRTLYLIDGVAVPQKIYERRQLFGEHAGAQFSIVDIKVKSTERRQGWR